jgi:iron(III) transport system substrate-binding protein
MRQSSLFVAVLVAGMPLANTLPSIAKEVRVYSGRHYNTDRQVFKAFSQKTGIKVRLIEATGITLVERLKREGNNSNADVILLVDAARINNAAKENLLDPIQSEQIKKMFLHDIEIPTIGGLVSHVASGQLLLIPSSSIQIVSKPMQT